MALNVLKFKQFRTIARIIFIAIVLLSPKVYAAQEVAQSFTLDGQLFSDTASTIPLVDGTVVLRIQILNPAETCILYEETQTVSTTASNGRFSVLVGSAPAAVKRSTGDSNNAMATVFSNTAATISGKLVSNNAACSYVPTASDERYVRIQVTPSDAVTRTLSPNMILDSVPTAIVAERAETIQGLAPASLLQVDTVAPAALSQANLESIFSTTNFPRLTTLLSVAPSNYLQTGANGSVAIPAVAGNATTPAAGQVWYDSVANTLKYYNGTTVYTVSNTTSVSATTGTIGGNTAVNTTGNIQTANDITAERFFMYDNSGAGPGYIGFRAPADIAGSGGASYTLTWPNADGTSGQVLSTDGSGNLSWSNGGSTPNADSLDFTEFKDAMALDASTDIAVSGTNVLSITNTGTGSSLVVNDQAADSTPFVIDAAGNVGIGTTTPQDQVTVYTSANTSARISAGVDGTGSSQQSTLLLLSKADGNLFGGAGNKGWQLFARGESFSSASQRDDFGISFWNGTTFTDALRIDSATGNVGIGTTAPGTLLDVAGSITSRPSGTATGQTGQIIMRELAAGGTNTFTIKAPDALTTDRTLVLPDSNGTSGQALTTDGSGNLSWATVSSGVSADSLNFTELSDSLVLDASTDISATGTNVLSITNTGTGNSFVVNDQAADTTPFVIDASGSVGIGTTTPGYPLDVNGTINSNSGLRLSGNAYTGVGTSAAPSHSFLNNSGSGMYSPVLNQLGFSSGGTERIRIDASGNVGIGTANPLWKLDVEGGVHSSVRFTSVGLTGVAPSAFAPLISQNTGGALNEKYWDMYHSSNALSIRAVDDSYGSSNTALQINRSGYTISSVVVPNGNVGIGTTTPGTSLDVAGAITSRPSGTATGQTGQIIMRELAAGGTNTFTIKAPDALTTDRALVLPDSNGTSGQVLSTDGSGNLSWTTASGAPTADSLDFTHFADAMTLDASTDIAVTGSNVLSITNTGTGNSFVVNDAASDTTPFVIDASGSVGINTTSPTALLQVSGTAGTPTQSVLGVNSNPYSITGSYNPVTFYAFYNSTTTNTGTLTGISNSVNTSGSRADTTIYVGHNKLGYSSTGGATETAASYNFVDFTAASGTTTRSYAEKNVLGNAGTGTITNAYGTYSRVTNTGGGTVTNAYGLYVDTLGGTNRWGIYQNGPSDSNYFAGNVGIGTTSPTNALEVAGTAVVNSSVGTTAATLSGAHTNAVTTITVNATTNYPTTGLLWIDSEAVTYTGTTATTFTGVTRGALGTTAASHANGAKVFAPVVTANSGATPVMLVKNDGAFSVGGALATGQQSVALGSGAHANATWSYALNAGASAKNTGAFAGGRQSIAGGQDSTSLGYLSKASAMHSIALGYNACAGDCGTYGDGVGSYLMNINLGNPATPPQMTGTSSLGIFLGDQSGTVMSASNVMAVMGGNVGIGTIAPTAKLDVQDGQIRSTGTGGASNNNTSASVDWNAGNNQSMSVACDTTTFTNMLDGGSYKLAVTDTTATQCTFSQSGLNFYYSPANASRVSGKMTLYSFVRIGSNVYVTWYVMN